MREGPLKIFGNFSVVAVIVGIVVGIGIFRLPSIIAQSASTGWEYILFWVAGGAISLVGALCYAELASRKPDAGGEYFFLKEAFGPGISFLFSWGRMTVIQTGSLTLAAFILGDYATVLLDLGPYSSSIYAGATVIALTGLNVWGTHPSRNVQNVMAALIAIIIAITAVAGILTGSGSGDAHSAGTLSAGSSIGAAMIFVLLTYGGWNEGVYLSAELKEVRSNISRVLVWSIGLIALLYVLINLAYLQVLGLEGIRNSDTIGVALVDRIAGSGGSMVMALIVIVAALSTSNATIITGARTNYALGRDFSRLGFLGRWNSSCNAPVNALLVQGAIALGLVILGSIAKDAVSTMVDYTAPVFWFFILLTTVTLFVFRRGESEPRFFRVPLFPLTPIAFIGVCLYLLYSSVRFTGFGALVGIGILLSGLPVYYWVNLQQQKDKGAGSD